MLDLTIHDIDEAVERELRDIAARNGRSLEEEARSALTAFVVGRRSTAKQETAGDVLRRLRAEAGGGADFEPLDRSEWKDRPVDFGL
ncbi:FitA-like ribbon-helix-helix domain-containing protein [Aureimonas leprariae]|uniref:FitA-like ribbon-helix-helix domain-containing protein n=1 Tax=Plantimonas leprariae TaxID=2615207 RepID=UPI001386C1F2|nr:plasmid stabilization protein [Aureimonas leprariae]